MIIFRESQRAIMARYLLMGKRDVGNPSVCKGSKIQPHKEVLSQGEFLNRNTNIVFQLRFSLGITALAILHNFFCIIVTIFKWHPAHSLTYRHNRRQSRSKISFKEFPLK